MSTVTNVILACAKSDRKLLSDLRPHPRETTHFNVSVVLTYALRLSGQQVRDVLAILKWSEPAAVRLLIQEEGQPGFEVWKFNKYDVSIWMQCVNADGSATSLF